ncbi:hypothetical protein [Phytohabitans rumicis]|uniref:Uncharacterized protein n=1 Tax=Phytohabitans rumicis TaxID=1076125 RepID=A0A6V8KQX9_9ACTN|nr:hypothetical protein [Phytohabitans rumicis]GFJ87572.1 hypothetical protein Prum_012140 [Phytohabitans rumicis]
MTMPPNAAVVIGVGGVGLSIARRVGPGTQCVLANLDKTMLDAAARSIEELVTSGGPHVVAGDDDGSPVVLATPGSLTTALAAADNHLLSIADRWVELRDEEGETIDGELAQEIVRAVAALAVGAVRTGKSLSCWIC